ncbi:unnamed protein product [Blepharisma stoltei]|uniref:Translin-associated factor X-interacting protein 1 N-terminal domain-containing protein n=1 Tax=Blepharisma stoltei TaxID=1481888 RepID=A0AAU9JTC7_9CILI|nr:unnamed protein product [Blepharisma stoltei]
MKKALPSINIRTSISPPKAINHSLTARSTRQSSSHKSSIINHISKDSFENSLENSASHSFSFNLQKPQNPSFQRDELKRLEEELDKQEIELKTYNFLDRNDPETGLKEFSAYKNYLEGLSILLKQQDARIGNTLVRGLVGLTRAYKKIINRSEAPKPEIIPKKRTREQLTQTYELAIERTPSIILPVKEEPSLELEVFKRLANRFQKISQGVLSQKLNDLHDSLCLMLTDVPSPSETPDILDINIVHYVQDIEQGIKVIQNEISTHLNRKVNFNRSKIDKFLQTDIKFVDLNEYDALTNLLKEKELKILNYKQQINLFKANTEDLQLQLEQSKASIAKYKEKIVEIEDKERKNKAELGNLYRKLEESEKFKQGFEQANEKLKALGNELYLAKLSGIVAQEKLSQIEQQWRQEHGGASFEYKNIDEESLIRKYNLKKIDYTVELMEPNKSILKKIPSGTSSRRRSPEDTPSYGWNGSSKMKNPHDGNTLQIPGQTNQQAMLDPNLKSALDIANSSDQKRRKSFLSSFLSPSNNNDHDHCNSSFSNGFENEKSTEKQSAIPLGGKNKSQRISNKKNLLEENEQEYFDKDGNIAVWVLKKYPDLESIPPHLRMEYIRAMAGHDNRKCIGECKHLKRARLIKMKAKGLLYPLKKAIIQGF